MIEKDDRRLRGQEKYLKEKILQLKKFKKFPAVFSANEKLAKKYLGQKLQSGEKIVDDGWDHEHCEFCWKEFADIDQPGIEKEGYVTEDNKYWICKQCYEDFKEMFQWKLDTD